MSHLRSRRAGIVGVLLVLLLLTGGSLVLASTSPGELDPSFGTSGEVILGVSFDIAVQPDGAIILAGRGFGQDNTWAFVRLLPDGARDINFGTVGAVELNAPSVEMNGQQCSAASLPWIALQEDGKIVAAGSANCAPSTSSVAALIRLSPDGSLDKTFGAEGQVLLDGLTFYSVAIQEDGKIVAAGERSGGSDNLPKFALARFTSDGSLDATFGDSGIVIPSVLSSRPERQRIQSIAIQQDGKILAAGYIDWDGTYLTGLGVEDSTNGALARLNEDGTIDQSFGTEGVIVIDHGMGDKVHVVRIADEKIVVAGEFWESYYFYYMHNFIARYQPDGRLDASFGTNGETVLRTLNKEPEFVGFDIASDGKLVLAGFQYASRYAASNCTLQRLQQDGSLDSEFGFYGEVTYVPNSSHRNCYSLAVQQDTKILLSGGNKVARFLGRAVPTATSTGTSTPTAISTTTPTPTSEQTATSSATPAPRIFLPAASRAASVGW